MTRELSLDLLEAGKALVPFLDDVDHVGLDVGLDLVVGSVNELDRDPGARFPTGPWSALQWLDQTDDPSID